MTDLEGTLELLRRMGVKCAEMHQNGPTPGLISVEFFPPSEPHVAPKPVASAIAEAHTDMCPCGHVLDEHNEAGECYRACDVSDCAVKPQRTDTESAP